MQYYYTTEANEISISNILSFDIALCKVIMKSLYPYIGVIKSEQISTIIQHHLRNMGKLCIFCMT